MHTNLESPIIVALDTQDLAEAQNWINALRGEISYFKLGLEFYLKHGASGIDSLKRTTDFNLFLDLKLHDIPNTVSGAVQSIASLNPVFLTVHASGGREMIKAAVAESLRNQLMTQITAVTVLTSLSKEDTEELGWQQEISNIAVNLAKIAQIAGAKAIVTSPKEVRKVREALGENINLITPGVRLLDKNNSNINLVDDQKRVMEPKYAINEGANFLVIGRPITEKAKISISAMVDAAKEINDSLV